MLLTLSNRITKDRFDFCVLPQSVKNTVHNGAVEHDYIMGWHIHQAVY